MVRAGDSLIADELKLCSQGCEVVVAQLEPFTRGIFNLARLGEEQAAQPLGQLPAVVGFAPHDYIQLERIHVATDAVPQ
jgi:hypothetical protein